jgi:dihydroorotase
MEVIFRRVKIIDPNSNHHHQIRDVWVKDGEIIDIKADIKASKNILICDSPKSCLSPGWIDVGCISGEPGNEHRETLDSLSKAAVNGGYTTVCCFPNTKPVIHSKSEVSFIKTKSEHLPVHILPIGAISKDCKSIEMAEILQMHEAGAIAFSDGMLSIQNSGLLIRALEYLKLLPDSILINCCNDFNIAGHGQMHEGKTSTSLGLKGIPALAESVNVQRDLSILKYTNSKLLIHKLSSVDSIPFLKNEKSKQKNLFASVSIFNLIFEDELMTSFNVNLKLDPPIRGNRDRKALLKAIADGVIDIICSDHTPWDTEKKDLEFQSASFGAISLETSFAAFNTYLANELNLDNWVQSASLKPASILNLPKHTIQSGSKCDLTWFNPELEWIYKQDQIKSVSKNSPFIGQTLKGKVLGTYSKNKFHPVSKLQD